MNLNQQLANRIREVYLNGKWVARMNCKELLTQITWKEANTKVGDLNTIALLTFHMNYYLAGLNHFFEKGTLEIRDKYSFDLKPIESEEDWVQSRDTLFFNAELFAKHVEAMPMEKLRATFFKEAYGSYYRNIEGLIEHGYYHLGQLVILKKMISALDSI